MPKKRIILGITGAIGAGKSAVAQLLRDRGYTLIIADAIGHEILARPEIIAELRKAFGDGIFDERGEIIRAPLATLVFADETTTKRFNRIVHPPLLAKIRRRCKSELNDVVLEAALLFEWEDKVEYDISVCVNAPEQLRRERTAGLYTPEDFSARQRTQLSPAQKMENADIVIENDGSTQELKVKIARLIEYLDVYKASGPIPLELTL